MTLTAAEEFTQRLFDLEHDGFTIVRDVIPPAAVDQIRCEVLGLHPARTLGHSSFVNYSQAWTRYLVDPRVLSLAEAVFGPIGTHTRVAATSAVVAEPSGATGTTELGVVDGFHADWPWSQSEPDTTPLPTVQPQPQPHGALRLPDVVMDLQTFWLLTEFNTQNGATHLIAGSHRAGGNPNSRRRPFNQPRPATELQVAASAGDVLVFDNRLWHKAGVNFTSEPRIFLGVKFVPAWLNIHIRRPGSVEHKIQRDALAATTHGDAGTTEPWGHWPFIAPEAFASIPREAQPLFRHWCATEWVMTLEDAARSVAVPKL